MTGYRGYEFDAAKLADAGRTQTHAIITVGTRRGGRLLALPFATYRSIVEQTYGIERVKEAVRINTSTSDGGMTEPELMDVLTNQVGTDGRIGGGTIRVLTLQGKDAAYLVPANKFWRKKVGEGE